mmetsp:Transcript_21390/g.61344  ORF Transcript_21390/g.61344 Transcript_21390/m.61344 type:complete len:82 (-) Transcript_21390:22-267(-)
MVNSRTRCVAGSLEEMTSVASSRKRRSNTSSSSPFENKDGGGLMVKMTLGDDPIKIRYMYLALPLAETMKQCSHAVGRPSC